MTIKHNGKPGVPQSYKDTTQMLADAGRFNTKPNYTGKKKGGSSYAKAARSSRHGYSNQ